MRTAGIDLAASAAGTAVCVLDWSAGAVSVERLDRHVGDDALVDVCEHADKVGIDCPLGWPEAFVEAVASHHARRGWPVDTDLGSDERKNAFRYRDTDRWMHQHQGILPLSVSTDRIGVAALRCAALLDRLAHHGMAVDRDGSGARPARAGFISPAARRRSTA